MSEIHLGLVGNPNCGKSTLFNALTGARQKVGNWPGVTVECKTGNFSWQQQNFTVVDLPGVYQLSSQAQAIDEKIACDYILQNKKHVFINIIDAAHLERHLFLTLQLLTLNIPLIIVVNMLDVVERRQIKLNLDTLQTLLGCPVIGMVASKGKGVNELKQHIANFTFSKPKTVIHYPDCIANALQLLTNEIVVQQPDRAFCKDWLAQQLLQNNNHVGIKPTLLSLAATLRSELENELKEDLDILFADIFFTAAHEINTNVLSTNNTNKTLTERLDKIILNRFLGIPIFLMVMYSMFLFAINLGGAFQDFFDMSSDAIFVKGTQQLLEYYHAPAWLIALLAAGFGRGINTTITFIPVIGAMFFFLAFLESTGYMARASFIIDRFMRVIGLPGKSFVPMIVGFGCNVPAILASRTLENTRDRALTILMSPFMSCGARLAIFAVFTAAFFPIGGQNVVFSLYMIGIIAAVTTGFILRKTLLKGELTPLVLELPIYHMPTFSVLARLTWQRLKSFIFRAGRLIVPICMLIGLLNTINTDGSLSKQNSSSTSLLSSIGRLVTPVMSPMGIQQDNWPATVGLVTGILAKEVVVATLNTLYTQDSHLAAYQPEKNDVASNLTAALGSIPRNLMALKSSLMNPILASAPIDTVNNQVYGVMYQRFRGQAAAFAYLLFVLLYFPCISATAAMTKELNKKWTLFSVAWSTGIAYSVATCFYQIATFTSHPKQSCIWIISLTLIFVSILSIMKKCGFNQEPREQEYVVN